MKQKNSQDSLVTEVLVWKCWMEFFALVKYIILTLNCKRGKNWLQKISNFKERDNSLLSWDREDHPEFKTERQIAQIKRWFQFHFWKLTCFCTSRVSCFSRLEHLQQSFSFFILTHAKLYEYSLQYATETGK